MKKVLDFYKNKRVLVTGHTGFKGAWLCKILMDAGAAVAGYALAPPTEPSLFNIIGIERKIESHICDIRDLDNLKKVFDAFAPEIVIHMAAQPIVREGYANPVYTYETNVMGTVNILECVRLSGGVCSFLNVTTDKVYYNNEWKWGYRENDMLDGYDPYSNSKSCSELVTGCYSRSFNLPPVSTARAGNVIGGGDFAPDRIIPDCVRAALSGNDIFVRNPNSTRPYQHVLEPLFAYLKIVKEQWENPGKAGSYNVGPDDCGCVTTGELADLFCRFWGQGIRWNSGCSKGPHEACNLKLDCSKIKAELNWKPRWSIETAVQKTVEWTKAYMNGEDCEFAMSKQIKEYVDCKE